jgi:hypothetical protein
MAPTIQFVEDAQCWEVRYGDKVWRHAQEWQCRVWFEVALGLYAVSAHSF